MDNQQKSPLNIDQLTQAEVIRRAIIRTQPRSKDDADILHLTDGKVADLEDDAAVLELFEDPEKRKLLAGPIQQIIRNCFDDLRLDLPPQIADLFHEADSILDEVERKGASRWNEAKRALKER